VVTLCWREREQGVMNRKTSSWVMLLLYPVLLHPLGSLLTKKLGDFDFCRVAGKNGIRQGVWAVWRILMKCVMARLDCEWDVSLVISVLCIALINCCAYIYA
jgi:hypothetical protein